MKSTLSRIEVRNTKEITSDNAYSLEKRLGLVERRSGRYTLYMKIIQRESQA